jgi:hypothetical protein
MNLTYEVTERGYTILLDGKPWIVQDKDIYIPFPAATMEESAELHIQQILKDNTSPEPSTEPSRLDLLETAFNEFVLGGE